jgi:hypothetical protein
MTSLSPVSTPRTAERRWLDTIGSSEAQKSKAPDFSEARRAGYIRPRRHQVRISSRQKYWKDMNPSRCHLTDEHRIQFVTHATALESGWSPIQFLSSVNEDVISEKRYIKFVVVC